MPGECIYKQTQQLYYNMSESMHRVIKERTHGLGGKNYNYQLS